MSRYVTSKINYIKEYFYSLHCKLVKQLNTQQAKQFLHHHLAVTGHQTVHNFNIKSSPELKSMINQSVHS